MIEGKSDNKIFIYNTMGRELQEFVPLEKQSHIDKVTGEKVTEVKMYHCGPTVYWNQHIGNMRAVVWADIVKRTIEYNKDANGNNYKVTLVRNYTDVGHLTGDNVGDADTGEDRMDKAARRDGKTPDEIANFYIANFEHDIQLLNADSAKYKPRATKDEYIKEIKSIVQNLLTKDIAYITGQGIYFDISKYPEYTKLSGQKLDLQNVGSGHGDVSDNEKRNSADFALWIFAVGTHADALQTWDNTFNKKDGTILNKELRENPSKGFPGWHIECSAMSKALLDKDNANVDYTLDIHMGGIEHIPVHHTNEIAQSECANDKKYVKYWIHNEHLLVDGKKMSKSEGTSYLLGEVINYLRENCPNDTTFYQKIEDDKFYSNVLRYFFLQAHYRSKQNFTWEALLASYTAYVKLLKEVEKLNSTLTLTSLPASPQKGKEEMQNYQNKFLKAINKDFNIPMALGIMWSMIKDKEVGTEDKVKLIEDFNKVFGLTL